MIGVNSTLPDGKHFIIWDFDNVTEEKLAEALSLIQLAYSLPQLYILETGTPGHYHAYCFKTVSWSKLIQIYLATPYLDKGFLQVGFLRGYYTLRISPKNNKSIGLVRVLMSNTPETVDKTALPNTVAYWTKRV
jgi:hypothetical protein